MQEREKYKKQEENEQINSTGSERRQEQGMRIN